MTRANMSGKILALAVLALCAVQEAAAQAQYIW